MGLLSSFLERRRRAKVQGRVLGQDRVHLLHRAERYVVAYANSKENERTDTLKTLSHAAWKSRELAGVNTAWVSKEPSTVEEDANAVIRASNAAIEVVLSYDLEGSLKEEGINYIEPTLAFITDAYSTVAVGYRYCARFYAGNRRFEQVGDAALKLLTIAEREFPQR